MAHAVAQTDCCHYNVIVDVEVGVDVGNLVCIVGFGCVDMPDWLCLKNNKKTKLKHVLYWLCLKLCFENQRLMYL